MRADTEDSDYFSFFVPAVHNEKIETEVTFSSHRHVPLESMVLETDWQRFSAYKQREQLFENILWK